MYRPFVPSADPRPLFLDAESQIRGLTQDFVTSFNTANYDQAGRMFSPDGVFMAPQHDAVYGQRPVERLLRQFGESGYQELRLQTTRIDFSGDTAIETGKYSLVIRIANRSSSSSRGKYLRVWRRLGAWLIVADCWSSSVAEDESATGQGYELRREAS